jgi:protein subunit release factor B
MTYPVNPSKENDLLERMRRLGIRESDLEESFVRSQGAGGPNVNKVSTCVILTHHPSGTSVKCQEARSQALNRFLARRLLVEKLEQKVYGAQSAERQRVEKLRRQKRRRSRRAKNKMLADKKLHSAKKSLRRRPGSDD